jgi:hypothetical protein
LQNGSCSTVISPRSTIERKKAVDRVRGALHNANTVMGGNLPGNLGWQICKYVGARVIGARASTAVICGQSDSLKMLRSIDMVGKSGEDTRLCAEPIITEDET